MCGCRKREFVFGVLYIPKRPLPPLKLVFFYFIQNRFAKEGPTIIQETGPGVERIKNLTELKVTRNG